MMSMWQKIHDLFNSRVTDTNLKDEFNLFHRSVAQKLWSTRHYLDELKSLNTDKFNEKYLVLPLQNTTQSTNKPTITQPSFLDIEGYCLDFNRILDGFFMNSMSALDTLAHQISTIYYFPAEEFDGDRIYISGIRKAFPKYHPNSEVGVLLDSRLKQHWFTEFAPFRHCTTHESLIPYDVSAQYDMISQRWLPPDIKLPENPKVRPPQQIRNREPVAFCQTIFDNIESLLNEIYEAILIDIRNNKDNLPIGKP